MSTKVLNILILGETGVGKSTWINGIANYFTYESMEDAEKDDFPALIHSKFSFTDDDGETRDIIVGAPDITEDYTNTGQSVTQGPTTYIIPFIAGNKVIHLIDTPGIGDTRGIDKDKENFEKILSHLSFIDEIHGICILLKPNDSRLTTTFRFCINELLTHLHQSAARNILFCFTNARATMYRPGETKKLLQELIDKNDKIAIKLNKETCFCFDNEAFRFLSCLRNGIKFTEHEIKEYRSSWETAAKETIRLIERISELEPHKTNETISLNMARKYILILSKPLALINNTIDNNINEAEDKKKELSATSNSKKSLMGNLYLMATRNIVVSLEYPRTVCSQCATTVKIGDGDESKTNYTTQCHEHCYLDGICEGEVNNPLLKNCAAMTGYDNSCGVCSHSWKLHLHQSYEIQDESYKAIDNTKQSLVYQKTTQEQRIRRFIAELDQNIAGQRAEKGKITNISAQFACFLKKHALSPYNDAIESYLEGQIKVEKDKLEPDKRKIKNLTTNQRIYREYNKLISNAMRSSVKCDATFISAPSDVQARLSELFKLPINGTDIKNAFNNIDKLYAKNGKDNVRHFNPPARKAGNHSKDTVDHVGKAT